MKPKTKAAKKSEFENFDRAMKVLLKPKQQKRDKSR